MTKKHFIALADVLKSTEPPAPLSSYDGPTGDGYKVSRTQWRFMVEKLADFCAAQNPAFDRARWLAYIAGECGPNGGKR